MMLSTEYPYKVEVSSTNTTGIFDWLSENGLIADEHYMFYTSGDFKIFRFKTNTASLSFQLRWGGNHV
jgi:hypothetical protein